MKTSKSIRLVAKVLLLIIPAIVVSVWGLVFGSANGRLMNVYLTFHSLVSID